MRSMPPPTGLRWFRYESGGCGDADFLELRLHLADRARTIAVGRALGLVVPDVEGPLDLDYDLVLDGVPESTPLGLRDDGIVVVVTRGPREMLTESDVARAEAIERALETALRA
jgi:hypothetical protein